MNTLKTLADRHGVWRFFEMICATPHPSGHEKELAALLIREAENAGLSARQDNFGNVRIDRKASPGYENAPCIIFQAHLDMVPQKLPGSDFDFLKDPLKVQVTGNKIHCGGETTLGADDGIGVALAMDLLTDRTLQCGPLAALFTREEEIGLNGAREVGSEFLKGEYLVNLDSGCDDCFYAGCAGGVENFGIFTPEYLPAPAGKGYKIEVTGLEGGHSGVDIHLKRGNAHKSMAFLLARLENIFAVSSLEGGSVVNAISRESTATGILTGTKDELEKQLKSATAELAHTFNSTENFGFKLSEITTPEKVWSPGFRQNFLTMLNTLPDGVFEFSEELDTVSTSCNLGMIGTLADGRIRVGCHPRAFDDLKWQALSDANEKHFRRFGGTFEAHSPYPGWKFRSGSRLLQAAQNASQKICGRSLPLRAVHAGLEPGIFTARAPELEMISFAPADHNCHTPEEYLEIDSAEKVAAWLRELVKEF